MVAELTAGSDPARRHDAAHGWKRGRAAHQGRQVAAVHSHHHADGARLHARARSSGSTAGADDYVTKPINYRRAAGAHAAMLRIKALQGAAAPESEPRVERELSELAITDALTGLYNRRHLDERLDEMFEHSRAPARAVGRRHVRHRPLQEGERHVRASGGRRRAHPVRAAPQARRSATSTGSGVTAARNSWSSSGHRARRRGDLRRTRASGGRGASVRIRGRRARSAPSASASPHGRIRVFTPRQQLVQGRRRCAVRRQDDRDATASFDSPAPEFNANVKDVDDQHAHGAADGGAARARLTRRACSARASRSSSASAIIWSPWWTFSPRSPPPFTSPTSSARSPASSARRSDSIAARSISPGDAQSVRLVATYEDPSMGNLIVDLDRYPELKRAFQSGETVFIPDASIAPDVSGRGARCRAPQRALDHRGADPLARHGHRRDFSAHGARVGARSPIATCASAR